MSISRIILIVFILTGFTACKYDAISPKELQEGDILFQDLDCGDACDAIEKVTTGYNGLDFSHCGIVANVDGQMKVVEAYGTVAATDLDSFLARSKDEHGNVKVIAGRPHEQDIAKKSAAIAQTYIGKSYDKAFKLGDDAYYCSELVYESYKAANNGQAYFPLNTMTFKEPDSTDYMPFWVDYYNELNMPIPEGDSGINPGAISRSQHLDILLINIKEKH